MSASWKLAYMRLVGQLRRGRERMGLYQSDIADRLGASRRTFQRWEAGEAEPSASQLFRWADMLGVTITSEFSKAPNLAQ
ncbi:helix-turn-helix transcriptional regulator [Mesorhizobium sp. KR1-2]|uniref:helix-turn-helix transcriptional regulator n=1 Tax=Mesorhizobium sp. KR1-2 TaxID=3156609 RepID=UPI0032B4B460